MKAFIFFSIFLVLTARSIRAEDFPDAVKKPVQESVAVRQQTQKAEDQWSAEKAALEAEYEALKSEQAQLTALKTRLEEETATRSAACEALERKVNEIDRIAGELAPCLQDAFLRLERHIDADLPFLMKERRDRAKNLRGVLDDDRVSSAEKFRKLMEALLIEAEYGNTVEVYQERIPLEGKEILVDVFRLGRLSLFFQSFDRKQIGYYNPAQQQWIGLPDAYKRVVNAAVEIGAKRRSAEVLNLPIGRIESK